MDKGRRIFVKSLITGSALVMAETLSGGFFSKVLAQSEKGVKTYGLPLFEAKEEVGIGFPQSIAAGDPTPSGAVLWARVDPSIATGIEEEHFDSKLVQWLDQGSTKPNAQVRQAIEAGKFLMVEISEGNDFTANTMRCFTPLWSMFDNIAKVDVDGHLDANKTYFYRFITHNGYVSKTGKFKTLPTQGAEVSSLKFAYVSCQDYTNGYYHAMQHVASEELDFVIHLGDYIYENVGYQDNNPMDDRRIKLPSGGKAAITIEDYRTLYRTVKADADLQLLHENHAMIATWDDHEFSNNGYGDIAPDESGKPNAKRRIIANQVWFEYMPARVTFQADQDYSSFKIYRSLSVGNLADIVVTDQRLFRSAPPCGDSYLERFLGNCKEKDKENRTMLGKGDGSQRDWFIDKMTSSNNTWKIWANAVQFTPLKILGKELNLDAWDGFNAEREYITSEIKRAGVKNWLTITGDLHTYEVGLIKENYKKDKDKEAVGVEFMVGSISSATIQDTIDNNLAGTFFGVSSKEGRNRKEMKEPVSSPIPKEIMDKILADPEVKRKVEIEKAKREKQGPQKIFGTDFLTTEWLMREVISDKIYDENPWLKFFDSTTHGYCIMEVSKNKTIWSAYHVKNIRKRSGNEKKLLFQCEVPRDQAEIHVLKD
ncbi:alkaline phosphatase [Mechercharimyces sp. CAU 1602]|uniref:alkaline phosphatase D family protein n=1 Tax=Mechercharimyces sp. CAU 1602 TaxID=2973933 RepID=UPI002161A027|nr:alkaline phosphatase D family protein [Mechercharimyces sp. CAU 1602]